MFFRPLTLIRKCRITLWYMYKHWSPSKIRCFRMGKHIETYKIQEIFPKRHASPRDKRAQQVCKTEGNNLKRESINFYNISLLYYFSIFPLILILFIYFCIYLFLYKRNLFYINHEGSCVALRVIFAEATWIDWLAECHSQCARWGSNPHPRNHETSAATLRG